MQSSGADVLGDLAHDAVTGIPPPAHSTPAPADDAGRFGTGRLPSVQVGVLVDRGTNNQIHPPFDVR